jgi:Tfp pilus assembly protein PilX
MRQGATGQRGVAMFIVMMLVVMVSAAGVFVARSSALEIRSSGFVRMAGQTHYVAESGAVAALAQMRRACQSYFTAQLRQRALLGNITQDECGRVLTSRGYVTQPCYNFALTDFDAITAPNTVFREATGSGLTRTEGSFGTTFIRPTSRVRVTELGAEVAPQRGMDVSAHALANMPTRFRIEATGLTSMDQTTFGADSTNVARSSEALRAITVIQCN